MGKNIAVFGYYNFGNIGDEAFKTSIPFVLGEHAYTYVNEIPANVNDYDLLVLGGGSFLDQPIPGNHHVRIPYMFLGVGVHGAIHRDNYSLIANAKMVVARNTFNNRIQSTILPDLVYARPLPLWTVYNPNGPVVVVLNGFYIPGPNTEQYKVNGWKGFRICLDEMEEKWNVKYVAMQTTGIDDRFMRPDADIEEADEAHFCRAIMESRLVVTTRFHGCVYSNIFARPYVGVSAHDKMRSYFVDNGLDNWLDYYHTTVADIEHVGMLSPTPHQLAQSAQEAQKAWITATPYIREVMDL